MAESIPAGNAMNKATIIAAIDNSMVAGSRSSTSGMAAVR